MMAKILDEEPASNLMNIPGVYETLCDTPSYDKEVWSRLQSERTMKEENDA